MKTGHSLLLIAALLATFVTAGAQSRNYAYTLLSPNEGYPTEVTCIYVEDYGYAWIGSTNGLFQLHNHTFSNFTHQSRDPRISLPGNYIYQLIRDQRNIIWVLTDQGVAGYTGHSDINALKRIDAIPDHVIAYCAVVAGNDVFFGGNRTIWKYTGDTGEFSEVATIPVKGDFKIERLLHGFGGKLLLFNKSGKSLYILNPQNNKVEEATNFWDVDYFEAFTDSRHRLWMSKFNDGVICFDHKGNLIAHYNTGNSNLSNNMVTCYTERDGKISCGTNGGGICIIDPDTGIIEVIQPDENDPRSFPASDISHITSDINGHIWASKPSGGTIIISQTPIRTYRKSDFFPANNIETITCMYQDGPDDLIWMGTNGSGIISFDPKTETFQTYPQTAGHHIYNIGKVDDETFTCSCPSEGAMMFNRKTHQATMMSSNPINYAATGGEGSCVTNDRDGRLIVFANKVMIVSPESGRPEVYDLPAETQLGHLHPLFNAYGEYCCDETHIYRFKGEDGIGYECIHTLPSSDRIRSAVMGQQGNMWLAVGDRIAQYNVAADSLKVLDLSFDTYPRCILLDAYNRLWIGTSSKLYVYDTFRGNLLSLNETDGVPRNEYVPDAKLVAANGDIYMAGTNGLVRIDSNISFDPGDSPEIVVSRVMIDGRDVDDYHNLRVPSDYNNLEIELFARDREVMRDKRYRISVDGVDHVLDIETENPTITLYSLWPGRYRITASCSRKNGSWTEPSVIYTFSVEHPWFSSWWFLTLLIAATFLVFLSSKKVLANKKDFEQELVKEDERYNFLVNVGHELRTPLTLVLGPLGRVISNLPDDDPNKPTLDSVYINADKMKTLVNTILATSKLQDGGAVQPAPVNLNTWIEESVEFFRGEASERGMELVIKPDRTIGEINIDENLCQIVFSNIMYNALRFNSDGAPITISTHNIPEENSVRVSVTDHGNGIGDLDVSQLFGRQLDKTEEKTGFGLGLSYSRNIIERHGGKIGAYNNKNDDGATFWFELSDIS